MPENSQVENNAASDQSSDNVEDEFGSLRIHEKQDTVDATLSNPNPNRPSEPDCLYYLRTGSCSYGNSCRFNHPAYAASGALYSRKELPERAGQPDCEYYLKTGTCKYGSSCKYHHPKDRNGAGPVSFNILGLPIRPDERSCPYYMRTGSCKFGSTCKFHHPQPESLGTATIPVNGSAAYGHLVLPNSGLPYFGGFPAWSLPQAPYISDPRLQGPTGYVPIVVSSSQAMLTVPGLNTYPQENASSSAQSDVIASSTQAYPERPDQPECRYYMNTGSCKYGSDCKYHHPKERIARLAMSTINLLGLPSRPGQTLCSNYIMHGLCKFGPACKFDHPLVEYPYTYGLSLAQLSVFDSSPYGTYPTMSSTDASYSIPLKSPDEPSTRHESLLPKKSCDASEQGDSDSAALRIASEPSRDKL